MKALRVCGVLLGLLIVSGCANTHTVSMRYQSTTTPSPVTVGVDGIRVGSFQDKRGTDSRWVGAIRGGYGNVLKRLQTEQPTTEVVREAVILALQARAVKVSTGDTAVSIEGEILKLDCSYFFNREAHAYLRVSVLSTSGRSVLYSQTYRTDNREGGVGAGIFGDVNHLAEFEQRTLNETIDKIFADPALIEALQTSGAARKSSVSADTEDRLRSLEQLKADGLVTEDEYRSKRKEILEGL